MRRDRYLSVRVLSLVGNDVHGFLLGRQIEQFVLRVNQNVERRRSLGHLEHVAEVAFDDCDVLIGGRFLVAICRGNWIPGKGGVEGVGNASMWTR